MANPPIALDYVTKDYEGFLQMMKDAIPIVLPEWTNYNEETDPGMVILQLASYGLHVLSYYQDKAVGENLLPLARTRKAILMLSRYLGYEPFKQTASIVPVEFTKDANKLGEAVTIPKLTQISTDPGLGNLVIFETDADLTIPAGTLTGIVNVTQGETELGEPLGFSDGTSDQSYYLTFNKVLETTIAISTIENGAVYRWYRVDSFVDSLATDRHYITTSDDDGRTRVTFGNGTTGMKVPYDVPISADYRYGGGKFGNVGATKINNIISTNLTGVASVINHVTAGGGSDAESMESIKIMAPRFRRTADRAVTPDDFELLAEVTPGVYKARCIETFDESMNVNLFLATADGTPASTALKATVREYIEERMIMNQNLVILDASYKVWSIAVTVYITPNAIRDIMETLIDTNSRSQFAFTNYTFGDDIYMSFVNQYIFNLSDQIMNVVISSPVDVITDEDEIPKFDNITITLVGGVI